MMSRSHASVAGLAALAALFVSVLTMRGASQDYRIEAFSVSGGGGTSSGGEYVLSGTIGEAGAGLMTGGDYTLAGGFWGASFAVLLPPPDESFDAWMDSLPPEEQPPEDQRGPFDDPAGDGMSNLLKYALGLKPMTPSRDGAPRLIVVPDPENGIQRGYLAVEFIRSKTAAVNLQLESSADLGSWSDAAFTIEQIEEIDEERERVRLISGISIGEHSHQFLRLRIDKL